MPPPSAASTTTPRRPLPFSISPSFNQRIALGRHGSPPAGERTRRGRGGILRPGLALRPTRRTCLRLLEHLDRADLRPAEGGAEVEHDPPELVGGDGEVAGDRPP